MKKVIIHIYIVLLLLVAGLATLRAQEPATVQYTEKISLVSDRTMYIAGENIMFAATLHTGTGSVLTAPSRVLYCELITSDGLKLTGSKFLIDGSSASGFLGIPSDIATGIFYIKAYTKLMRNSGPSTYSFTRIKIINPERNEVQSSADNISKPASLSSEEANLNTGSFFNIRTDKTQYSPRETVNLSISGTGLQSPLSGLSVSVVPDFSVSSEKAKAPENGFVNSDLIYYSENRGLSVTGTLTDSRTGVTLPGTRVNLSIIGQGRDFMAIRTDETGRFYFSLPDYTGYRDIFLCADNTELVDPRILVDNDFCTIPLRLPTETFTLTPEEREAALGMALNAQVETFFNTDTVPVIDEPELDTKAFYGEPTEILLIDNYVQLPNLEEYFNGLPTTVKVRKREGEKYFKILGPQTDLTEYDPLVMVDLVAIDDPVRILAINPANILRIEIVNGLYVKGDQTYGGIINIISKRGDFAGIDLPSSGIFVNYSFFADSLKKQNTTLLPHTPDPRNTLYWNPKLTLGTTNTTEVTFNVSDTPGRYLIVVTGVDGNGEVVRQVGSFEVLH